MTLLNTAKDSTSNNWLNIIIIKDNKIKKDNFIRYLYNKNFGRPIWKPLQFKASKKISKMNLKITNTIYEIY